MTETTPGADAPIPQETRTAIINNFPKQVFISVDAKTVWIKACEFMYRHLQSKEGKESLRAENEELLKENVFLKMRIKELE